LVSTGRFRRSRGQGDGAAGKARDPSERQRKRSRRLRDLRVGAAESAPPAASLGDVESPAFVDVHSHVCPSGDDGARTVADGVQLCREAASRGTAILFATPHVWPHLLLGEERERAVRDRFARLAPAAGLDLRLGWELTPCPALLRDDPRRYELDGTGAVLMEVPFAGPADALFALAEHVERAGLRPVIAHPERTEALQADPRLAHELVARGWLLQLNATSLTGYHGPLIELLAWDLIEDDLIALVASDGHRAERPPHVDEAYRLAAARLGDAAGALFDGSALGVTPEPFEAFPAVSRAERRD
jgi:protein-tyrosine phosphatase